MYPDVHASTVSRPTDGRDQATTRDATPQNSSTVGAQSTDARASECMSISDFVGDKRIARATALRYCATDVVPRPPA